MTDENMKDEECAGSSCDCELCQLVREMGSSGGKEWFKTYVDPILDETDTLITKRLSELEERLEAAKRNNPKITSDDLNELWYLIEERFIHALLAFSAAFAQSYGMPISTFCRTAAQCWVEAQGIEDKERVQGLLSIIQRVIDSGVLLAANFDSDPGDPAKQTKPSSMN